VGLGVFLTRRVGRLEAPSLQSGEENRRERL